MSRPNPATRRGTDEALQAVLEFLSCRTPQTWLAQAPAHLPELLIDHANCEKKAAGTALSMLYRYVDKPVLLRTLSKLAREELRHFEQVLTLMETLRVDYVHLSPSRYAGELRRGIRQAEPGRLVDTLLMGAVVEARSCERFLGLIDVLPAAIGSFYQRLLESEARHFQQYLGLAERYASGPLDARLQAFLTTDAELVRAPDTEFRFHSGPLSG
jgi:tRNA-(ms[2]io[6]A)-hydroxylase